MLGTKREEQLISLYCHLIFLPVPLTLPPLMLIPGVGIKKFKNYFLILHFFFSLNYLKLNCQYTLHGKNTSESLTYSLNIEKMK